MRRPCLIPIIDNQLIGFVGWFVRGVLQKKTPGSKVASRRFIIAIVQTKYRLYWNATIFYLNAFQLTLNLPLLHLILQKQLLLF